MSSNLCQPAARPSLQGVVILHPRGKETPCLRGGRSQWSLDSLLRDDLFRGIIDDIAFTIADAMETNVAALQGVLLPFRLRWTRIIDRIPLDAGPLE